MKGLGHLKLYQANRFYDINVERCRSLREMLLCVSSLFNIGLPLDEIRVVDSRGCSISDSSKVYYLETKENNTWKRFDQNKIKLLEKIAKITKKTGNYASSIQLANLLLSEFFQPYIKFNLYKRLICKDVNRAIENSSKAWTNYLGKPFVYANLAALMRKSEIEKKIRALNEQLICEKMKIRNDEEDLDIIQDRLKRRKLVQDQIIADINILQQ